MERFGPLVGALGYFHPEAAQDFIEQFKSPGVQQAFPQFKREDGSYAYRQAAQAFLQDYWLVDHAQDTKIYPLNDLIDAQEVLSFRVAETRKHGGEKPYQYVVCDTAIKMPVEGREILIKICDLEYLMSVAVPENARKDFPSPFDKRQSTPLGVLDYLW